MIFNLMVAAARLPDWYLVLLTVASVASVIWLVRNWGDS